MGDGKTRLIAIQRRGQAVSMACLPACLAMLFSNKGQECRTCDVIELSLMPYRISCLVEEDLFLAGGAFKNDSFTQGALARSFGLELCSHEFDDLDAFSVEIRELILAGNPVVISVNQYYLPSAGYDALRRAEPRPGGHAVVVHGISDSSFYISDPRAGVRGDRDLVQPRLQEQTQYEIGLGDFRKAVMATRGMKNAVGVIRRCEGPLEPSPAPGELLKLGVGSVDGYDGELLNGVRAAPAARQAGIHG